VYLLSPQRDRDRIRKFVRVQLQESTLPPRLKVSEALQLFASLYPTPLDPQEVLEPLVIKHIERTAFKNLSGGQKPTGVDSACVGGQRPGITPSPGGLRSRRSRAQLAALLKVQAKLSLREPYALGVGVGLPAILLIVFGFISRNVPGDVGGAGLTVIDLYIPVVMVISFVGIAISSPTRW
jgi:hypothetical protein